MDAPLVVDRGGRKVERLGMGSSALDLILRAAEDGTTILSLAGVSDEILPGVIGELRHLRHLDIRDSGIRRLPPEIGNLSRLEGINALGGKLESLPPEIGRLSKLQHLDIQGCPVRAIPEELWDCKSLETLTLGGTFTQLPPGIQKLKRLRRLKFDDYCQLYWYPRGLSGLSSLETIILPCPPEGELPPQLFTLTGLQRLFVNGSGVVSLPPEIRELTALREIDLDRNVVRDLPTELGDLHSLITLHLKPDFLPDPLGHLYSRGLPALISYLRDEGRDGVPLHEIKVLLVGEGEVGKSSLVSAFHREPFKENRPTTHGIELRKFYLPHPEDPHITLMLRLWDFGGQEVYRITHQFFFSRRSLYLLVWKPRQGQNENMIDFWLRLIRLRIGRDARVMIVATHGDERRAELDVPYLKSKFAPSLLGQWIVDNSSGSGLDELERSLALESARFPQMGRRLSKRWVAVRDRLAQLSEPQIHYSQYHELCLEYHLDQSAERTLIELLHDLGTVVHFSEDDGLRDIIVLQPEWLTKAIGYVLEDEETRHAGGVLTHARLKEIWHSDDPSRLSYSAEYHPYFLRLMEKFDVSYRMPEAEGSLVAQLVPYERPAISWRPSFYRSSGTNELSLICDLADATPGLIAWLTVRNYRFSTGLHWRRGVFLCHRDYNLEALIELVDEKR